MGDDKQYTAIMMVVKQISGSSDKYLILQIFVSFGPPCVQIEEVMYLHLQKYTYYHCLHVDFERLELAFFLQQQSVCDNKYTLEIVHLFSPLEISTAIPFIRKLNQTD